MPSKIWLKYFRLKKLVVEPNKVRSVKGRLNQLNQLGNQSTDYPFLIEDQSRGEKIFSLFQKGCSPNLGSA